MGMKMHLGQIQEIQCYGRRWVKKKKDFFFSLRRWREGEGRERGHRGGTKRSRERRRKES